MTVPCKHIADFTLEIPFIGFYDRNGLKIKEGRNVVFFNSTHYSKITLYLLLLIPFLSIK